MLPQVTETKFAVLAAVVDHCNQANFGPTVEEIRATVGLGNRSSVQWHINHLKEDDLLYNTPKKHRSLRPTPRGKKLVEVLRAHADSGN